MPPRSMPRSSASTPPGCLRTLRFRTTATASSSWSWKIRRSAARLRGQQEDQGRRSEEGAAIEGRRSAVARLRSKRCRAACSSSIASTAISTRRSCRKRSSAARTARVNLVFEIKEGDKLAVRQIVFAGNNAFSATKLKAVVKTGVTNVFELSAQQRHLRCRPDRERSRSVAPFLSRPWLCRCAGWRQASYDAAQSGVVLTFKIDEGPHYRFGKVEIDSSVTCVDPAALARRPCTRRPATSSTPTRSNKTRRRSDDGARQKRRAVRRTCARSERPRASSAPARAGRRDDRSRLQRSNRANGSMSSASTSTATPRPTTTSSAANSISARATPIIARWSTAASGTSRRSAISSR